jgi:hypothetical protein
MSIDGWRAWDAKGGRGDAPDERRVDAVTDGCPDCQAPCGAPTLLTSMVRYYTCAWCGNSWQILRDLQGDR